VVLSSPIPADEAVGVALAPTLSIHAVDYQGDDMDIHFRTNASGSDWATIGTNSSVGNGTYSCFNTSNMSSYNTKYWWSVNVTDGRGGDWTNQTFSFTTRLQPGDWYIGWSYRKEIIINHSKVDTDLLDFPVLINFTDIDLAGKAQSNGNDIVFTDYSGNKLNHEIELYDNNTGQLVAWVNTSVSSTVDTVLYMYYGNPSCGSQENIVGVWDSSYLMVQLELVL